MATFVSFCVEPNENQCDTNLINQGDAKYLLIRVQYMITHLYISLYLTRKAVQGSKQNTKGVWCDIVRDSIGFIQHIHCTGK